MGLLLDRGTQSAGLGLDLHVSRALSLAHCRHARRLCARRVALRHRGRHCQLGTRHARAHLPKLRRQGAVTFAAAVLAHAAALGCTAATAFAVHRGLRFGGLVGAVRAGRATFEDWIAAAAAIATAASSARHSRNRLVATNTGPMHTSFIHTAIPWGG